MSKTSLSLYKSNQIIMNETKLITSEKHFLKPLQEFEKKQNQLVKENPFIEITNTETFESAKKSRTSLVKGRTELQKQQKLINDSVNSIKSAVKNETERLIEITKPAEELQQTEVKRHESIQEEKRIERERIEQEKNDKIQKEIDEVIDVWTREINNLTFETIKDQRSEFDDYFEGINTEIFQDLEIYFNGKHVSLISLFNQKVIELEKDQELLVSQSENRFQQFKTKWMERFMYVNRDGIKQLNIDFDTEVPSIDADTFFTFKDQFIQETNKFRDKLIDITNSCKLEQQKADEEKRIEDDKTDIKIIFIQRKRSVEDLHYDDIKLLSRTINDDIEIVRKEYCPEFKELIELNISDLLNKLKIKVSELTEEKKTFEESEKVRIAESIEDEKKQLALTKKNDATEKKRQKELKPFKDAAINQINHFTPNKIPENGNEECFNIVLGFVESIKSLQKEYLCKISEL